MLGFEVAYHGQHFTGWHRQRSGDGSAQAQLECSVSECLRDSGVPMEDVRLNALTDVASAKGAHSRGQLCFFRATPEAMALVQSRELGLTLARQNSIVAGPLRSLGASWPRASRLRASYFFQQGQPVPELAPFAWYVREDMQLLALQRAAAVLEGTHDLSCLSRRARGGRISMNTTIECARVKLLPATVEAFDLQRKLNTAATGGGGGGSSSSRSSRSSSSSSSQETDVVSQGAGSRLLRLEILTAEGSGKLPSQLMQRLAALLRRVATPKHSGARASMDESEELARTAEGTMRAVLGGSSSEADALLVAPARGLWLEEVVLQNSSGHSVPCSSSDTESVYGSSTAIEPPPKRASTRALCPEGSKAEDAVHTHSAAKVQVHTVSARVLLSPATGVCWVGPQNPGSQRLRVSDYNRLLQLNPERTGIDGPRVVVGVNSAALPQFFSKVWPRVHENVRCVILSADSDWGVPGEVWAKGNQRSAQGKTPEPTHGLFPSLQDILEDPRLVAWFTQNYDFGFGCHLDIARGCFSDPSVLIDNSVPCTSGPLSSRNSLNLLTVAPLHKLRPLPIGIDFHSLSQKAVSGVVYRGMRARSAECQQAELDMIAAALPPFATRPVVAYGSRWRALSKAAAAASPFSVSHEAPKNKRATTSQAGKNTQDGGDDGCCPRAQALRVFSNAPYTGHITIESEELNRSELWRRHGNYSFVISPPGHGLDCHRTWEALALGCIPITLAPTSTSEASTTTVDAVCAATEEETRQNTDGDTDADGAPNSHPNSHTGTSYASSWQNPLFTGLPVVVVQRWEDVTERALHIWRDKWAPSFDTSTPQGRALTDALRLEYWCTALR